jgi:hypothetical protein
MKPPTHLLTVCKIGQGHECCRYVLMSADGWMCGKVDPASRKLLDDPIRRARFTAQGDNCDGVADLEHMPRESDAS